MEGTVLMGDPARASEGAALDSRRVRGGELFFALPGAHADGHRFAAEALLRGAAAAVVARGAEELPGLGEARARRPESALIRVADTFAALHDLTRATRRRVPRRLVAITGSAGKTTTKELLAAMLERRFRTARNPGNLNNLYGFPIALLGIPDDTEWMVAEMGMSEPGELGRVSRLGRPDVAVFTNVRAVHLEFFGTLEAIAEAKAELLEGLAPDGLVVANAGDPLVRRIAARHRERGGRCLFYGHAARLPAGVEPALLAEGVRPAGAGETGSRFTLLNAAGERREVHLALHGPYNVDNCLAAATAAHALGVSLADIAAAAAAAAPAAMRGVVRRRGGVTVIDDVYNSNPAALEGALAGAAALAGKRRWAVLGDMLELGPRASEFHREAGRRAAELGFSPVAGVGELARQLATGAAEAGARAPWFASAEEAARWAGEELEEGDVVLVKGSRGIALEAVVEALLESAGEAGEEGGG